jgi:phosphoesterase RecJ-like protein
MLKCTLSLSEIQRAQEIIDSSKNIVLSTHQSPDGDAVGSVGAMSQLLKALNKNVKVVFPDDVPSNLNWVPGTQSALVFKQDSNGVEQAMSEADLLIILDYNHLGRIGDGVKKCIERNLDHLKVILIDHHEQPAEFPQVIYSDTSICSTCEMVFHFAGAMNWLEKLDVPIMEAIYCGMMTDTMSFRFPSVTAETHEIVSFMMKKGLKPHVVHEQVHDVQRLEKIKLTGFALSNGLHVLEKYKAAYIVLTKAELDEFNPQPGDTEGLVNMALSIEGTTIAAFFREDEGCVRISFRSKGTRDVNKMARAYFNGGGHKNAAGARMHEPLNDVIQKFHHLLESNEI